MLKIANPYLSLQHIIIFFPGGRCCLDMVVAKIWGGYVNSLKWDNSEVCHISWLSFIIDFSVAGLAVLFDSILPMIGIFSILEQILQNLQLLHLLLLCNILNPCCHFNSSHSIFTRSNTILLEKEMATHSSVLAWRIPGTGEPGRLPSMGSHRVGHDWSSSSSIYKCHLEDLSGGPVVKGLPGDNASIPGPGKLHMP